MSLFQAREFWSAATGTEEEFGGGCLAVANLDNDSGGPLKIAIGSFSGMLRLYFPRERDFKLEDLMLDQRFYEHAQVQPLRSPHCADAAAHMR